MAKIETKNIRNVALLGHGGCGKTTLAEAMLYIAGETDRLGSVAAGNTVSDYDPEEIARKFSISASMAPLMWKDVKINVIDMSPHFFQLSIGDGQSQLLLAFGQGDPQLPPGGKLVLGGKEVFHLLAGIAGIERCFIRAIVLHGHSRLSSKEY